MKKLLFFGELYPYSIHGIAIANETNIKLLENIFSIDVVLEEIQFKKHAKISLSKFSLVLNQIASIIRYSKSKRYNYFYLVFSLSTFGGIKTLLAILCFRIFNKGKVVIHIHRGDFFSRFYNNTINKVISKLVICLSQKIIVLSEKPKLEIECIFNKNCDILYNTVGIECELNRKASNKNKFIYISNYLLDKGILDLLEVFKKLNSEYPQITLETYGAFSNIDLKEKILSYSSSKIQIHETINGIDKYKKIAEADCLILPSWNEGQPIVLLEAMSIGTPIIATNVGLIPDLLGADYLFLANAQDQLSLERTIIQFIESDRINEISKELKDKYNYSYSNTKHKNALYRIFN